MYRNSEGYADPTVGAALSNIRREEKAKKRNNDTLVYICSPYAGDIEANVANAKRFCRIAIDNGYVPFAPHLLYPQVLNDSNPNERSVGIRCGMTVLKRCRELWVFGPYVSKGMKQEIEYAENKGYIKIRYFKITGEEVKNASV